MASTLIGDELVDIPECECGEDELEFKMTAWALWKHDPEARRFPQHFFRCRSCGIITTVLADTDLPYPQDYIDY